MFELIEGTDLRERLRQEGMIAVADALAIAIQVANGLAAAHARRCVHRDLKPGNILIGDDGRVCVADFGIARALEEPGLTQPGRVLGTGEYVSPEQALGRKVDAPLRPLRARRRAVRDAGRPAAVPRLRLRRRRRPPRARRAAADRRLARPACRPACRR